MPQKMSSITTCIMWFARWQHITSIRANISKINCFGSSLPFLPSAERARLSARSKRSYKPKLNEMPWKPKFFKFAAYACCKLSLKLTLNKPEHFRADLEGLSSVCEPVCYCIHRTLFCCWLAFQSRSRPGQPVQVLGLLLWWCLGSWLLSVDPVMGNCAGERGGGQGRRKRKG